MSEANGPIKLERAVVLTHLSIILVAFMLILFVMLASSFGRPTGAAFGDAMFYVVIGGTLIGLPLAVGALRAFPEESASRWRIAVILCVIFHGFLWVGISCFLALVLAW